MWVTAHRLLKKIQSHTTTSPLNDNGPSKEGSVMTDIDAAIKRVRSAIYDCGPRPDYHLSVMTRHRSEWPHFWEALDALLAIPLPGQVELKVGGTCRHVNEDTV